jgi:hypothetical protein
MAAVVACFKLRAWRLWPAGGAPRALRRKERTGAARRSVKPTQLASSKAAPPAGERSGIESRKSIERKMPWEQQERGGAERQGKARAQGSLERSGSRSASGSGAEQMLIEQVKERIRERAQAPPCAVAAERKRPVSVVVAHAVVGRARAAGDATRAAMSRAGQHVAEIKLRPELQEERPKERRSTMDSTYSLDSTGSELSARSFGSGSGGSVAPKPAGAKWKPLRDKVKRLVVGEIQMRPVSSDVLRLIPEI